MATGTIQKNMVLLWANPNPSASFAAQTVSVNLSSYDAVLISMSTILGGDNITRITPVGIKEMFFDHATSGTNLATIYREITVTASGVSFATAYSRAQGASEAGERPQYLRPKYIYGIRF